MYKLMFIVSLCVLEYYTNGSPMVPIATRIWGGADAPENSAPYKAALIMKEPWLSLVGGGSIISKNKILTAAQCIERVLDGDQMLPHFQGVVGTNQWHSGGIRVNFDAYYLHPDWDNMNLKYDVGILKLEKDLDLGKSIAVIGVDFNPINGDESGFVTGYGMKNGFLLPSNLQHLNVRTLPDEECKATINELIGNIAPPYLSEVEICTYQPVGDGMCLGDVGNALVSDKTRKIIGIASWGFACAFGVPDVFTRTSAMKEFLTPHVEIIN